MCTFLLSYVWPGRTFSEQLLVSTGCCSVLDIRYIHIHRYKTLSIYHHIAQKVITFYSLFTVHFASTLDLDHVFFVNGIHNTRSILFTHCHFFIRFYYCLFAKNVLHCNAVSLFFDKFLFGGVDKGFDYKRVCFMTL